MHFERKIDEVKWEKERLLGLGNWMLLSFPSCLGEGGSFLSPQIGPLWLMGLALGTTKRKERGRKALFGKQFLRRKFVHLVNDMAVRVAFSKPIGSDIDSLAKSHSIFGLDLETLASSSVWVWRPSTIWSAFVSQTKPIHAVCFISIDSCGFFNNQGLSFVCVSYFVF